MKRFLFLILLLFVGFQTFACPVRRWIDVYLGYGRVGYNYSVLSLEVWKTNKWVPVKLMPVGLKVQNVTNFRSESQLSLSVVQSLNIALIKRKQKKDSRGHNDYTSPRLDIQGAFGISNFKTKTENFLTIKPELAARLYLFSRFWLKAHYAYHIPTANSQWNDYRSNSDWNSNHEYGLSLLVDLKNPMFRGVRPKSWLGNRKEVHFPSLWN